MFQRMLCPLNSPGSLWEWGTTNTCSGSLSHSSGSKVMSKPCFHTPPSGLSNLRMEYTSSIWNEMQTRYLLTRQNKYATVATISQWELWLSISSKKENYRKLTWTSAWPWLPAANWQSWGLTARKVGRPSKGSTQEPLALLNGRWPLGDTAPVSVSSITESFIWLMIWWFSSRSCSSCSIRFCRTEIWL